MPTQREELDTLRKMKRLKELEAKAASGQPQPAQGGDILDGREVNYQGPEGLRVIDNMRDYNDEFKTTSPMEAFASQAGNAATVGNIDGLQAARLKAASEGRLMGGDPGSMAANYVYEKVRGAFDPERKAELEGIEDAYEKRRGTAMQENPISSLGGTIAGSLAPGGVAFKGLQIGAKMLPGAKTLANAFGKTRATSYGGRMARDAGIFTADSGLYGATTGASDEAALAAASGEPQRDMSALDRAKVGKDYMTTGVDVKGVNIPIAPLMPIAGSAALRSGNMLRKGYATPDNIAAEMAQTHGRGVKRGAGPQSIAQTARTLEGQLVGGDARGMNHIYNALRSLDISDARITAGFENIKRGMSTSDDPTLTFARLIESEFADDAPGAADLMRRLLLKVGMDTPDGGALVQRSVNQIRGQQSDILESEAKARLGQQPKTEAKGALNDNLGLIGEEGYGPVLKQMQPDAPGQAQAAKLLQGRPETADILFNRANQMGVSVDEYVARNPLDALHWVQSELGKRARQQTASQGYSDLDGVVRNMKEVLRDSVPNYRQLDEMYASNAKAYDRLGTTNDESFGTAGELKYSPGFGDKLFGGTPGANGAAKREEGRQTAKQVFDSMDEQSKKSAAISVRDVILDDLGRARAAGLEDRYATAAKFRALQTEGGLDALEEVFGADGKALADRVRQFVDANQFARDIDPQFNSQTANKLQAQETGARPFASAIGRKMGDVGDGVAASAVPDAVMMANGAPPIFSAMRAPGILGKMLQPRPKTQQAIASTLLKNVPTGQQVPPRPAGPGPIVPLKPEQLPGRPANAFARSMGYNPQSDLGAAALGAGAGGLAPADSLEERGRNIAIGAGGAVAAKKGGGLAKRLDAASMAKTRATSINYAEDGADLLTRAQKWADDVNAGKPLKEASDEDLRRYMNQVRKHAQDTFGEPTQYRMDSQSQLANRLADMKLNDELQAPVREVGGVIIDRHMETAAAFAKAEGLDLGPAIARNIESRQMTPETAQQIARAFSGASSEVKSTVKAKAGIDDGTNNKALNLENWQPPTKSSGFGGAQSDIGNAALGAAVGGFAPADSTEERTRNAFLMAGATAGAGRLPKPRHTQGSAAGLPRKPKIQEDIPLGTPKKAGPSRMDGNTIAKGYDDASGMGAARAVGDASVVRNQARTEASEMLKKGSIPKDVHKRTGLMPIEYNGKTTLIEAPDMTPDQVLTMVYTAISDPAKASPPMRAILEDLGVVQSTLQLGSARAPQMLGGPSTPKIKDRATLPKLKDRRK